MSQKRTPNEIASTVEKELENSWAVEADEWQMTVQGTESPIWARIELRQDESCIVTGYRDHEWDGREVAILLSYVEADAKEPAVEQLIDFCRSQANKEGESLNGRTISVESIIETVAKTPAVFAAAPEDYLARGLFGVVYHTPAGTDGTPVRNLLDGIEVVTIGGQPFRFGYSHVLHSGTHYHRRVPLYSEAGRYGLDSVSSTEGINRVCEFVENDTDPSPLPSETIVAPDLLWELVDAGATAIAVQPELSDENTLTFQVWMPPKTGYDIVGPYESVKINDDTFELDWEFNCVSGPSLLGRVTVYVSKDLIGGAPVSLDEGLSNLKAYLDAGCPRVVDDFQGGDYE